MKSRIYVTAIILVGMALVGYGLYHNQPEDYLRYAAYLLLAAVASTLKVRLPGITGTYSLNFLIILVVIVELELGEALGIACVAALTQCLWRPKARPSITQLTFNMGSMALTVAAGYAVFHSFPEDLAIPALAFTASVYFVVNTLLVSVVLCLVEMKPLGSIWEHWVFWAFPYYLVGTVFAGSICMMNQATHWFNSFLLLPLMYLVYRYYRTCVRRAAR